VLPGSFPNTKLTKPRRSNIGTVEDRLGVLLCFPIGTITIIASGLKIKLETMSFDKSQRSAAILRIWINGAANFEFDRTLTFLFRWTIHGLRIALAVKV
jgi:hypothetical protein